MSGYDQFFKAAKKAKTKPHQPKKKPKKKPISKGGAKNSTLDIEKELRQVFNVKKKRPRPKLQLPSGLTFVALCTGLLLAGWGFYFIEDVEKHLSKIEIGWLGQVIAAEETSTTKGDKKAKTAGTKKDNEKSKAAQETTNVTEELSYFAKLRERKAQLDLREQELNQLEEELHKQKSEIEARIAKLERMRRDIAGVLKDRVEVDQAKVGKLVDFYSNMKPAQAADILGKINEDLAVEVLGRMKKKNAADILNLLEPQKARTLSEKFAGYKRR